MCLLTYLLGDKYFYELLHFEWQADGKDSKDGNLSAKNTTRTTLLMPD